MEFNWLVGFVFPYINFLIFFSVALLVFKRPLQNIFAGQRSEYESQVAAANLAKDQAQKKNQELESRLNKLAAELESIRAKARNEAEKSASKLLEEADRLGKHMLVEAQRMAAAEVSKAKAMIQDDVMRQVKEGIYKKFASDLSSSQVQATHERAVKELKQFRIEGR